MNPAVLTFLTAGAAIAALVIILVVYLVQAGQGRAGLAPAAVSLALIGPVCAIGAASKHLAQTFTDVATAGTGGTAAVVAGCKGAQSLMRLGDTIAILALVLAAGLGALSARSSSHSDRRHATRRRLGLLLALLLVPAVVVGFLHEYARATNRMAVAVVEAPSPGPEQPGVRPEVIEAVVSRMSSGILLGALGVPVLVVLLAASAAMSAIIAWKAAVPPWFRVGGTLLLLLLAVLLGVGILFFERPVELPGPGASGPLATAEVPA